MNVSGANAAEENHIDPTFELAVIVVAYAVCVSLLHLFAMVALRMTYDSLSAGPNWLGVGITAVFFGNIAAQVLTIVAYAGLANGRSFTRIVLAGALIFFGAFVMLAGSTANWGGSVDGLMLVAFSGFMLLVFCLALIPFWILRVMYGWRMGPVSAEEVQGRFRLEHLFGWMTFLVLPLLLIRMFISASVGGFNVLALLYFGLVVLMLFASSSAFIYSACICERRMAFYLVVPIASVAAVVDYVLTRLIVPGPIQILLPMLLVGHVVAGLHLSLVMISLRRIGWRFSTFRTRVRKDIELDSTVPLATLEGPTPHPLD